MMGFTSMGPFPSVFDLDTPEFLPMINWIDNVFWISIRWAAQNPALKIITAQPRLQVWGAKIAKSSRLQLLLLLKN